MVICITKRILDEKYHLSKIWLAAHWEKKMKRAQIFEIDIEESVRDIMDAEIILDLRISGHLLVGIVKIHSKKTKYLLTECSTIFCQVKIFRAGRIDLPESKQTASANQINLTEYLNDNFDVLGNDIVDAMFSSNQSRIEDITLKEVTTERLTLLDDDMMDFEFHEEDEPFELPGGDIMPVFNDMEALKDATVEKNEPVPVYNQKANEPLDITEEERLDEFIDYFLQKDERVLNALRFSYTIRSPIPIDECDLIKEIPESIDLSSMLNQEIDQEFSENIEMSYTNANNTILDTLELEPLNVSSRMYMRTKSRKRKLRLDYIKRLSEEDIQKQVLDTSDIMSAFDLAPSSKRLMTLKNIGCAEKLFRLPFLKLNNNKLLKLYEHNLKTRPSNDFDSTPEEDETVIKLQKQRKRSRAVTHERPAVNGDMILDLNDSSALNTRRIPNFNMEDDFPQPIDNFMDNVTVGECLDNQATDILLPESLPSSQLQINSINDLQSTPVSKTSQEKWEFTLQGRIIKTLHGLKQLFEEQSTISFSNIVKKNRRLLVAQKFLCLLMLKKFEVISLEQRISYGEIFISPGLNFDSACLKLCST